MTNQRRTQLRIVHSPQATDLEQAIDVFLLDGQARNLSPRTIRYYRERLTTFLTWLQEHGIATLAAITPNHMRAYLVHLQEKGLNGYTQHTEARAVRAWLNFCVREDLLTVSPMSRVRMPKQPKDILPAFSPDDVRKLLTACRTQREIAVVLCLLDTGCRAAELCALAVGDLDGKSGSITVEHGKGDKGRVTFLGAKAHKAVKKHLMTRAGARPDEPLFPSELTGDALTVSGLEQLLRRLGKRAGVDDCHPHTFRRSFALWSLRAGMDIYSLQKLMGHSDLTVLRRYLDESREDLQTAHKRYGAVDNML